VSISISGSAVDYGGGGGGSRDALSRNSTTGTGGVGGGGKGCDSTSGSVNGTANLGGGGGGGPIAGGESGTTAASGGSGVVILRTEDTKAVGLAIGGSITSSGGYYIYTFNSSGTIKWGA